MEFLESFRNYVEVNILGRDSRYEAPGMNSSQSEEAGELYKPFQAATSEATFRQYQHKID